MKKIIIAVVSAMVLLSQTACVIRYKLPEEIESQPENSQTDLPVINSDTEIPRTIGSYIIKNLNADGVEIIEYIGEETDISVPKELDGSPVLSIGNSAFAALRYTQSITVPDGVENIGNDAFNNCRELVSLELPDSVSKIGERAFADCVKLKRLRIPEKVSVIEAYTFYNCYVIKEITLPDGITSIGQGAFFNCAQLVGVILPEKLKIMESEVFYNCLDLESIKLPDSLEHLGRRAFDGCFNLEEIFFKGTVYNVNLGDDHYDHSELLFAVNGELEEEEDNE